MLNVLELPCPAGSPYIQPTVYTQQVVRSFQEELIKSGYLWLILQSVAKKVIFLISDFDFHC